MEQDLLNHLKLGMILLSPSIFLPTPLNARFTTGGALFSAITPTAIGAGFTFFFVRKKWF
jgi:hypothetical protein